MSCDLSGRAGSDSSPDNSPSRARIGDSDRRSELEDDELSAMREPPASQEPPPSELSRSHSSFSRTTSELSRNLSGFGVKASKTTLRALHTVEDAFGGEFNLFEEGTGYRVQGNLFEEGLTLTLTLTLWR